MAERIFLARRSRAVRRFFGARVGRSFMRSGV